MFTNPVNHALSGIVLDLHSGYYALIEHFIELSPELIELLHLQHHPGSQQVDPVNARIKLGLKQSSLVEIELGLKVVSPAL